MVRSRKEREVKSLPPLVKHVKDALQVEPNEIEMRRYVEGYLLGYIDGGLGRFRISREQFENMIKDFLRSKVEVSLEQIAEEALDRRLKKLLR